MTGHFPSAKNEGRVNVCQPGNSDGRETWVMSRLVQSGNTNWAVGQVTTREIFCSSGVKEKVIDRHNCQHISIAGCTKDVRGVRMGSEREKLNSVLKALVSCDGGFDLLMSMFFWGERGKKHIY